MPEKSELSTISQKIRKLLALADGNKNEHERDAAMKLAMELLSKHNLDLSTVTDESNEIQVIEIEVVLKLEPWIRSILHAVCKLYYTDFIMRPVFKGYFYERKEWHPSFVGTRENIGVTMDVSAWLINSIRQESNWLFTEPYQRRSFRLGAAHKVLQRALELIEEERKNGAQSTQNSLMIVRNNLEKANHSYKDRLNLGTFQGRGSQCDGGAYGRGESFGDSVNLGRSSKPKAITMKT